MPIRKLFGQTYDEIAVVAKEPIPVDIGSATVSIGGDVIAEIDGIEESFGTPTDAAASTDTETAGLLGLFKRLLQRLTTVIGHVDDVETLLGTIDVDTGSIEGKLPALVSNRIPVDGSGVTQPVSGTVKTLEGLSIPEHDYVELGYTGDDITSVTYKDGGTWDTGTDTYTGGTTVGELELVYSTGKLVKVVRT